MKVIAAAGFLLVAFFGLSAVVGERDWFRTAISYALLWPPLFAFVVLPGVLLGFRIGTWQSSVVATEIITIVGTAVMVHPTLEEIFQPSFGKLLAMAHLVAFVPLLLSILLGRHYSRSWRSQTPT
jgi:hypothetical protein